MLVHAFRGFPNFVASVPFLYWFPSERPQNCLSELGLRLFLLEVLVLRIHSFFPQALTEYLLLSNIRKGKKFCAWNPVGRLLEAVRAKFCRNRGRRRFPLPRRGSSSSTVPARVLPPCPRSSAFPSPRLLACKRDTGAGVYTLVFQRGAPGIAGLSFTFRLSCTYWGLKFCC